MNINLRGPQRIICLTGETAVALYRPSMRLRMLWHGPRWNTAIPLSRTARIAREADCPAIAVVMLASFPLCRERNRSRQDGWRLTEERMDRMIGAFEPVRRNEGFTAMFGDSASLCQVLESLRKETIHEYCDQAR